MREFICNFDWNSFGMNPFDYIYIWVHCVNKFSTKIQKVNKSVYLQKSFYYFLLSNVFFMLLYPIRQANNLDATLRYGTT